MGSQRRYTQGAMTCTTELPISAKYVMETFGEQTRDFADMISEIYCMHHEFASNQINFSKPELRVEHQQQDDECVVTVRGGVGIDTRLLTSSKMQEMKFEYRCRDISIDTKENTTKYTISRVNKGGSYFSQAMQEYLPDSTALVKHNTSRNSVELAQKLSIRRMQRTINLYTRSNRHVAEFDVFLQTSDSDRCMIMTINNVVHMTTKFMFGLLHDPIAKIVRARHCTSPDDDHSYELRLWFDCVHVNSNIRKLDEEVDSLKSHKRITKMSRLINKVRSPY